MNDISKIKQVVTTDDGHYITTEDGVGVFMDKKYNFTPAVGDQIVIHTTYTNTVRGMDINGKQVYYKSDKELEDERREWLEKHKMEKQKKYKEGKTRMDAQYKALPEVFQRRIDRFRANNPNFRIDFEPYELFCCEQALIIANACKTATGVEEFRKKTVEQQFKDIPHLSREHSGNTFDCSCALAYNYLLDPENVVNMNGALAPLVGSKAYGDIPQEVGA